MTTANEILINEFEMSLNGEETDDDTRGDLLEAIQKLEGGFSFPTLSPEWSVIDIHSYVWDELNIDLPLDDVELFGKLLKVLNQ